MTDNVILDIENVSHKRNGVPVLHEINLKIARGETIAVVGPSGSGKSTLLNIILGAITADQGDVYLDDVKVVEPSRDRGIVYQKYSLMDFHTIDMNVALGPLMEATSLPCRFLHSLKDLPIKLLKKLGFAKNLNTLETPYLEEAHAWLERFGLLYAAKRYPSQLSGGMQQRCAIAQSLIMRPKVLLMDEPFGALDPQIRDGCQQLMLDLQKQNRTALENQVPPPHTVIFVTHDCKEAIRIADRVVAISQYHPKGELGATIVFDQATPNFDPYFPVAFDFPKAIDMERNIRDSAMDPKNTTDKSHQITFWNDVGMGLVKGVYKPV